MDEHENNYDARDLTVSIVSAYVANNSLRSADLPVIIASVYEALVGLGQTAAEPTAEPLVKPVSVKKSIHSDYLISMEDGKQYKSLKRHLAGRGLTPAEYREKWGLPSDYPMTAPAYSERRSALARSFGLGQKRSKAVGARQAEADALSIEEHSPELVSEPELEPAAVKPKRGRKKAEPADQAE